MSAYDVVVGDAFFTVLSKPFDLPAMAQAVVAAADRGRISHA